MKKMQINANMAWALVCLAAVIEWFWASGLKYAPSFWVYCLVFVGIPISFAINLIACRVIEVSVVYSVFVGLGAAGIVATEIVVFGEPFSFLKVALITLLVCAAIALKTEPTTTDANASKLQGEPK